MRNTARTLDALPPPGKSLALLWLLAIACTEAPGGPPPTSPDPAARADDAEAPSSAGATSAPDGVPSRQLDGPAPLQARIHRLGPNEVDARGLRFRRAPLSGEPAETGGSSAQRMPGLGSERTAPRPSPGTAPKGSAPATQPSAPRPAPDVEIVTAGAGRDDRLPMVVLLHGLGDTPAGIAPLLSDFKRVPIRIVALGGSIPYGQSRDRAAWFLVRATTSSPERLAQAVADAADDVAKRVREAIQARPTVGKPLVVGFSQGGMLAYALAVRHPDLVAASFPISGLLPEPLRPDRRAPQAPSGGRDQVKPGAGRPAAPPPPIVALHGEDDRLVPFVEGKATVDALREAGYRVEAHAFEGVAHSVSPKMKRKLFLELERHLRSVVDSSSP